VRDQDRPKEELFDELQTLRVRLAEAEARRERAEKELRDSQARFQAFMDHSPVVAFMKDRQGRLVYLSAGFERAFGVPPARAVGKTVFDLFPAQIARALHEDDERARRSACPEGVLELVPTPDGVARHWLVFKFPFQDSAGRHYLGGVAIDLTERRQAEERVRQAEKVRAIGGLAGGVAHHFNNLLTVVLGFSEVLLAQATSDDPWRDGLGQIRRAAEQGAELARRLLAFGRRQLLAPRLLRPNELVARVAEQVRPGLAPAVELRVDLAPAVCPVHADPAHLEEALRILAENAREAMPRGGRLTLATAGAELPTAGAGPAELPPGRYAVLSVADTGTGLTEAALAHLYEPFFTTKGPGEALGLGLATVYGFVKQSGGEVEVRTDPGRGTTVRIYLPCRAEPGATAAEAEAEGAAPRASVLVVDPEDALCRLLRMILEPEGYHVLEAGGAGDALRVAAAYPAALDLLVTEADLGHDRGPDLAERLTRDRPGLKVLYLAGHALDEATQQAVQEGRAAVLWKPFGPGALLQKVRAALGA